VPQLEGHDVPSKKRTENGKATNIPIEHVGAQNSSRINKSPSQYHACFRHRFPCEPSFDFDHAFGVARHLRPEEELSKAVTGASRVMEIMPVMTFSRLSPGKNWAFEQSKLCMNPKLH